MSTPRLTHRSRTGLSLGYVRQASMGLRREVALPAALAALGTIELVSLHVTRLAPAVAVEAAACALLVFRKQRTLLLCTGAALILMSLPYFGPDLDEPAVPILIVALASFSLARYVPRNRGLIGMAAIFLALVVTQELTLSPSLDLSDVMFLVAVLAPPYAFGWLLRRLADSHATETRLLLERQEAARSEAVAAERARIARELHDVLAHSVSAMVVQAEAASDLVPRAPDRAVVALDEVTRVGRTALAETGRVLRLIRDSDDELGLSPDPGLDRLPELVEGFRRSGLRVLLDVDGSLESLPAGVAVSGYRIVEEALTNALKYAVGRAMELTVRRSPTALLIAARNQADTAPERVGDADPAGGLGLVGMRERVSVFGGTLSYGSGADGVFELTATLPLPMNS
jgi:signal transduction histidine kinase